MFEFVLRGLLLAGFIDFVELFAGERLGNTCLQGRLQAVVELAVARDGGLTLE